MSDILVFDDHHGVRWYKYACRYIDQNGKSFCMDMWAINDADAELRAAAVRQSFVLEGRMCSVVSAENDEVLSDDSLPVTDGLIH